MDLQAFVATVNAQPSEMPPLESGDTLALVSGNEVVKEIVVP